MMNDASFSLMLLQIHFGLVWMMCTGMMGPLLISTCGILTAIITRTTKPVSSWIVPTNGRRNHVMYIITLCAKGSKSRMLSVVMIHIRKVVRTPISGRWCTIYLYKQNIIMCSFHNNESSFIISSSLNSPFQAAVAFVNKRCMYMWYEYTALPRHQYQYSIRYIENKEKKRLKYELNCHLRCELRKTSFPSM